MLVGLCGNPNVGKSTLFNRLTGLRQHTGNWPGKTVGSASGCWKDMLLVDTPGSYSLAARSAEEELTRDFVLFSKADKLIMVADASNLRRSLLLVLQVLELRGNVLLCVNLMDEAERNGMRVDCQRLSAILGIPVLPMNAAAGEGVEKLYEALEADAVSCMPIQLPEFLEKAFAPLTAYLELQPLPARWLARTLVTADAGLGSTLAQNLCLDPERDAELARLIDAVRGELAAADYTVEKIEDYCAEALVKRADELCRACVSGTAAQQGQRMDRILTHPLWGLLSMLVLLSLVLWLTMAAANVPSDWLCGTLFAVGEKLRYVLEEMGADGILLCALFDGIWRTSAWVTAVMLPPMAVFFPLFTLLEDLGYLPRVAFFLDGAFQRCGACGKQGLCMLMGLGCNAVGVTGSRIIDSLRERLIAQLTNVFMPCNGRFPMLITVISIFFAGRGRLFSALLLALLLVLGVLMTFVVSYVLSATLLRGQPSSFALELPPYRKPQWKALLLRSLRERTLPMLGRAVCVAAPTGLLVWLLANVDFHGIALLQWIRTALDGAGRLLCMDGAILLGFILALPANEIALPSMLLIYTGAQYLQDSASLAQLGNFLRDQGWDVFTAAAVLIFTLCHWPCATTLRTIRKESGSLGSTILAAALPTVCGVILCALLALCRRILVA